MKTKRLLILCLSACSPSANRTQPTNASPTPTPQQTPHEYISRHIDDVAQLARLPVLRTANLPAGDAEVCVWYGFGLFPLQGFVIKRTANQWAAFHLKAADYLEPNRIVKIQLPSPKSGWDACWQRLVDSGVLSLPNGTEGPDPDVEGFYVETLDSGKYRNYEYMSLAYSDDPNAKHMLTIGEIIFDEFGLKQFHVTKPSQ